MVKYMLDTNICIFTIKKSLRKFAENSISISIGSVTLMELIYGAEKSNAPERNHAVIEGFAGRHEVLNYDTAAVVHTDQIRAEQTRQGRPIGPYELMIAGHTRSCGLIVVTNNTRDFERVSGLGIEDWVQ